MNQYTHTIDGRTYRVLASSKKAAHQAILVMHREWLGKCATNDAERVKARTFNLLFVPTLVPGKGIGSTMRKIVSGL